MKKIKKSYLYVIITIFFIALDVLGFISVKNRRLEYNLTSGNRYLSVANYSDAQIAYQRVLKGHKYNIEALLGSGKAYLLKGDFNKAEEQFNKAIDSDKTNKDIYIRIQNIYEENNRLDAAMDIIKLAYSNTSEEEFQDRLKVIKEKLDVPIIDLTIKQGSAYGLPENVKFKINGEDKDLPVVWNNGDIDTNQSGEFIIEGINEQYDRSSKVTLKVLAYIKAVEDVNVVLNEDEKYSLPTSVKANMSDGTEKYVTINWNNKKVNTSEPGNYVFEGTVNEYDNAVKLNLQVKEVIKPISDREILSLVINAHNSLMEIIDDYMGMEKVDLINVNEKSYIALPTEFNSYNKLYAHFNKYWSVDASKQLIKLLDVKDRDGIYSRRFGEIGLGYCNTSAANIESKSVNEKKITVIINSVDSVNEPKKFKAELTYSGGHWWVNYWQWASELLDSTTYMASGK